MAAPRGAHRLIWLQGAPTKLGCHQNCLPRLLAGRFAPWLVLLRQSQQLPAMSNGHVQLHKRRRPK